MYVVDDTRKTNQNSKIEREIEMKSPNTNSTPACFPQVGLFFTTAQRNSNNNNNYERCKKIY